MSGSQRALKIMSIIIIVISIFMILGGLFAMAGGALLSMDDYGNMSAISAGLDPGLYGGDVTMTVGEAGVLTMQLSILITVIGVVKLIVGIFGLRGANDSAKIGAFRTIAVIGVVLALVDLGYIVITGALGMISPALLINTILIIVCLGLSNTIKKEASTR